MREVLKSLAGSRLTVHAVFERFGTRPGWKGKPLPTVLLTQLTTAAGQALCDHLWFSLTKELKALDLQPGDQVAFEGRAKTYKKGYHGPRLEYDDSLPEPGIDYKLSHPNHVRKINPHPVNTLPLFETH